MLHTNAISYTNKFSKIRKNIRLCKFKNKNTRILLDKIVLSLPAGNFLTRSFSILALFSFFYLEQLGFLITGWPHTVLNLLLFPDDDAIDGLFIILFLFAIHVKLGLKKLFSLLLN